MELERQRPRSLRIGMNIKELDSLGKRVSIARWR